MIVTGIERQKRHPDRVNLYLDGEFAFGLHREVLLRAGLRKGDELSPEALEAIKGREEYCLARQNALRLISYRMRSERELRSRLLEKEFEPRTIDRVIEDLRGIGMLDDAAFARAFIHDARMRRPTGRRLLTKQLRLRGVTRTVLDEALGESAEAGDEESMALAAAKNYLRRSRRPGTAQERQQLRRRTAGFLERRGFEWSLISTVLRKLFRTEGPIADE